MALAAGSDTGHPALDVLAAYADRTLTSPDAAGVERHLSTCSQCRDVLNDGSAFLADRNRNDHRRRSTAWRLVRRAVIRLTGMLGLSPPTDATGRRR
jgi:hypothetical protein